MAANNGPARSIDGVYANYAGQFDYCQITLAAAATLLVGQPVSLLSTNLGPNNGSLALPAGAFGTTGISTQPQCEQVVATSTTAASVIFGVFTGNYRASSGSNTFSAAGITNGSTASVVYTIEVQQKGFGPVLASATTGGTAVTVGASLIGSSTVVSAVAGTAALFNTVGKVLGQYNVTSVAAAITAGSQAVTPANMAGITTSTPIVVDIGVNQETVTPSAITAGTAASFTATFAKAHAAGVQIAVIQATSGGTVLAVPTTATTTVTGLVSAFIQVC